jgi:Ca-activated chloride channel family protein
MSMHVAQMTEAELTEDEAARGRRAEPGLGALATERGNLPLERVDAAVRIAGLVARIELTQGFHNPHDMPLEATYVFPLPDRAAVTALRLTADDRTVEADLRERAAARESYDQALAQGRRAAIAEEERPDVFTMRVGNILPGERVTVALTLVGPLSYEDGEATFRLPLVVAPRYIPGAPSGTAVGDGYADDTDAVPDASRITPPVLLPGFPNPVRLSIGVDIDPGGLPLGEVRSSLHAVVGDRGHVEIRPGERLNRDFVLRLGYGEPDASVQSLSLTPDDDGDEGTFRLTILPPTAAVPPRPRDVVLVLDRSGSMGGWKMVAARRAAARIVDTLTAADRFAVLAFDHQVEQPPGLGAGLHEANDRNRFSAVGYLSTVDARGGTELLAPLTTALALLTDPARDRVVVLVTDGQVGNEDHILRQVTTGLAGVRVHTVGIDQAVNAGFLGRLAGVGGGRCELVESADRLDAAMEHIHRRIGAPTVTGLRLSHESVEVLADTVSPAREGGSNGIRPASASAERSGAAREGGSNGIGLPDLFPGAPLVVTGRYRGTAGSGVTVTGRARDGALWTVTVPAVTVPEPSLTKVWARAHLRDLEDRYASIMDGHEALEQRIVAASLRFGVLCRFTAWVAVDARVVVENGERHRVIQPVEPPAGWDMFGADDKPTMTLAGYAMPLAAGAGSFSVAPASAPMSTGPLSPTPLPLPMSPTAGRPAQTGGQSYAKSAQYHPLRAMPAFEEERTGSLAAVAAQAADELTRLRGAAGAPDYERRELLADLGTRLDAVARELERGGAAADQVAAVRELAAALVDEELPDLDALWARAESLLELLAAGGPAAGAPAADAPAEAPRKPFWKR